MLISRIVIGLAVGYIRSAHSLKTKVSDVDVKREEPIPGCNTIGSPCGNHGTLDDETDFDQEEEEIETSDEDFIPPEEAIGQSRVSSFIYRNTLVGANGELVSGPVDFTGTSTYDLFLAGLHKSGKKKRAFGYFENRKYKWLTYSDMDWHVRMFGRGIMRMGLHGPTIVDGQEWRMLAIYSEHRLGWTMTELAAARHSVTLIPLYETSNPDFVRSILRQTQVTSVVAPTVNARKLLVILRESTEDLNVRSIILLGTEEEREELMNSFADVRVAIILFKTVKFEGMEGPVEYATSRDDVNTICFTSGTTGEPKGVLITNGMLLSVVGSASMLELGISRKDRFFAFLPPAHIFERVVDLTMMFAGARIGYYSGDKLKISRDVRLVAPTVMAGVPRSLEKTLEKIDGGLLEQWKIVQWIMNRGLQNSDNVMNSLETKARGLSVFSAWSIRQIRAKLGGRLRLIMSGGGPLSPESQAKLKQYLHVYVVQGYGLTETTGGTLVQHPKSRTYGIVGVPLPCAEVKLVDQEIHGGVAPGAGELLVRGPSVFSGYFRRPELNAQVFTADGWFRTGDLATIVHDENGKERFKIVGRSKEIFKLPNGEYVVPALLENIYKAYPAVEEIFIDLSESGDSIVALVKVKEDHIQLFLDPKAPKGIEGRSERLLNSEELGLVADLQGAFKLIATEKQLPPTSLMSQIVITKTNFGPETEYQTVTMKPKRALIRELLIHTMNSIKYE